MNTQVKMPRPAATETGAKVQINHLYFTTSPEECKALISILGQEHIIERERERMIDAGAEIADTEEILQADRAFATEINKIGNDVLARRIEDLSMDYACALEKRGFYDGFRCALSYIFGGGQYED